MGKDQKDWPQSLDEAVERLLDILPDEAIEQLREMPRYNVDHCHFALGMYLRDKFGLWRDNRELLKSCGSAYLDPDSASQVIIQTAWKRLQKPG